MSDDRRFHARVNSPRGIVEEALRTISADTDFSSDSIAITKHRAYALLVELYPSKNAGHEQAICALIQALAEYPMIASWILRVLVEKPPVIPAEHAGNLFRVVESWILWALQRGYGTEQSIMLLALVRIHRQVTERFERVLIEWQRDKTTHSWDVLVKLGTQYPSVVYPIVMTKWALPTLSGEEGHALMVAISGIDDPAENVRYAPAGVEPHHFDPDNRFSSWYEWLRRWSPVVAPYRLWYEP